MKFVIVMEGLPKTIPPIYNLSITFKFFMMILLPLLLMRRTLIMWRILMLLCIWIMIRMFHVMVILWISSIMLLEFTMREGHGFIYLNNIKSPLFLLKFFKFHLLCLSMLVASCFNNLFS